jgi:hypothetical protein
MLAVTPAESRHMAAGLGIQTRQLDQTGIQPRPLDQTRPRDLRYMASAHSVIPEDLGEVTGVS